jgi:hypothetical protein
MIVLPCLLVFDFAIVSQQRRRRVSVSSVDQPQGFSARDLETPGERGGRRPARVTTSPRTCERFLDGFIGVVRTPENPERFGAASPADLRPIPLLMALGHRGGQRNDG